MSCSQSASLHLVPHENSAVKTIVLETFLSVRDLTPRKRTNPTVFFNPACSNSIPSLLPSWAAVFP
jgi:hypothetical protein